MNSERDELGQPRRGQRTGWRRHLANTLVVLPLVIGIALAAYAWSRGSSADNAKVAQSPVKPPSDSVRSGETDSSWWRQKLRGRWRRPDGGYVLEIRDVAADGAVQAAYFNPRPIHVAAAQVRASGNTVMLAVELRDVGYDGHRYTLTYDPRLDRLVGTYLQTTAGRQFEIWFERVE